VTEEHTDYITPEYKKELGGKVKYNFTLWGQLETEMALISNSLKELNTEVSLLKEAQKKPARKTSSPKKRAITSESK
tara:strand:- start:639 stop:869 length:231 start_codon:yes stop_codon:yes gene_type:complete